MSERGGNLGGVLHVRKWFTQQDETLALETGREADGAPVFKIAVAAVLQNPYAGVWAPSLDHAVQASGPLGEQFKRRLLAALGGRAVQSYGKAMIVGVNGEYEHGNAFLTTTFANPIRQAVGDAKSWMPSTGKRGGPGTTIDIPLAHKDALYVRSHYDTLTATFHDAPGPDEILVTVAVATRGRLHARLGGLQAADIVGQDGLV